VRAATWWIDRWRKSTAYTDMTLAQQGAYRNLLDECWLRPGGIIPSDERILRKIAGATPGEWTEMGPVVMARFRAVEGGYVNDTALAVISQAEARIAAKAAGGRSRWDSMTEEQRRAFVASGVASRNKQNKQTDKQDDKQQDEQGDKQSNKPPVSGLRSPESVLRDQVSDPGFFETLPADAGAKVKKARVVSPQDSAARRLAKILGSSLNVCRAQVGALVAKGATIVSVEQAITEYAEPGMKPWDWTRKVAGGGGGALTGDQIRALGARWEQA